MFLRLLLIFCVTFSFESALAQFQIGHTAITFVDPTRANRQILTEIYYPANSSGDNVPPAAGSFPTVNFGHGFVMVWSAYQNIWESLVPEGFIVCFPRTEGSILPNHTEFAKDLAFLCTAMTAENTNSSSLFFNHVSPGFAVLGHSMGGGCSILARQYNTSLIKCVGALAPANTNPSAITAAAAIGIPSIIVAGSYDCIAPPAQHAQLIWESLQPSLCKLYVNITGASHCQFANQNTNCSIGESTSGCSNPPISRPQQQALTMQILLPWLKNYLADDNSDVIDWLAFLDSQAGFTKLHMCNTNEISENETDIFEINIQPNPVSTDFLLIKIENNQPEFESETNVFDAFGRLVFSKKQTIFNGKNELEIPLENEKSGIFTLQISNEPGGKVVRRFCKTN